MYDGLFLGSGANACHIFPPGLFRDGLIAQDELGRAVGRAQPESQ
jgi:hypothetical protein